MMYLYLSIGIAFLALIYAFFLIRAVLHQSSGEEKAVEIGRAIQNGSSAYLRRQYKTVGVVAVVIFFILGFAFASWPSAFSFLIGALFSALAGFGGMNVAVRANTRVAESAKSGLSRAFDLAFKGGAVTGFLVVGLGLLSVSFVYLIFHGDLTPLISLGFGASLISVFARLGGGIFTKAADVGADLVGKVEAGIPEDDPRNPAVIADNVGDNVGDCAGMAADLFETYVITIVAGVLLGVAQFGKSEIAALFPFAMASVSIVASVLGSLFVRVKEDGSIMGGLYKGLIASSIIAAAGFWVLSGLFFQGADVLKVFFALLVGIFATALIMVITDYYTAKKFRPVKSIAEASQSGHGTNVIIGLSVGMESTTLPIIVIGAGILASFWLFGLYGVALAAISMLSMAGIIVAIDSFGPITDNAGGIAEMAGLSEEVRKITDPLDAVGNTTKAITKGYAIASAGLAVLVLFAAFQEELVSAGRFVSFDLSNPKLLVGIFFGAAVPYLFGSLAMRAVGKAAGEIVSEVRMQFKEIKGIMDGTEKPDYRRAVDIATKAALREMIIPTLLPIAGVLAVGFILGVEALGGFLIGSIVSGLFVAISMTTGGAAWDNAKKYIEEGRFGGKKSFAHQAAVTGDTVGDSYKDTAGPAINPLIKVINIVALLMVRFL